MDHNSCVVFLVIRFDTLMKYQHQVQQQIHSTADTHDLRCTVCHGVFSSRGDLDSHMLTHTLQKLTSTNNLKHKVNSPELEPLLYGYLLFTAPTCSLSHQKITSPNKHKTWGTFSLNLVHTNPSGSDVVYHLYISESLLIYSRQNF